MEWVAGKPAATADQLPGLSNHMHVLQNGLQHMRDVSADTAMVHVLTLSCCLCTLLLRSCT